MGSREAAHVEPARSSHAFDCVQKDGVTQQYAIQIANGPSATENDRFAAKLLATIVGDDSGSRLFWALVDPGLAEHASIGHYDYQGTGMYLTYVSCAPEAAADNLQSVLDIYRDVEAKGVTEEELEQAKNKINSRVVLSSERPRGRLFNVGSNWTYRHEYRSVKDDLDRRRSHHGQIAQVLARYPLSVSTTVTVGSAKSVLSRNKLDTSSGLVRHGWGRQNSACRQTSQGCCDTFMLAVSTS